jgi:hypothetical protein
MWSCIIIQSRAPSLNRYMPVPGPACCAGDEGAAGCSRAGLGKPAVCAPGFATRRACSHLRQPSLRAGRARPCRRQQPRCAAKRDILWSSCRIPVVILKTLLSAPIHSPCSLSAEDFAFYGRMMIRVFTDKMLLIGLPLLDPYFLLLAIWWTHLAMPKAAAHACCSAC